MKQPNDVTTEWVEGVGGLNRTTNTAYTLYNQIAALMAVNSTTGNQISAYVYGTTLGDSGVARNDLLSKTIYPDAARGWADLSVFDWGNLAIDDWANLLLNATGDVTTSTYNRLGQQATFTDQRGTVRTFYYDKLGRPTNDCVTTNGTGTDVAVKQIATDYDVRGMVTTKTSYDSATQNSGAVLNQIQLSYNSFGQLTKEQQSHSGTVGSSTPNVQYGFDSGASSSNEIRPATLTYPNARVITSSYGTSGGMNDYLNRIDTLQDTTSGTTNLASYASLGSGTVVRITYPQPSVWLDLWGGISGTFAGLDQFNRIIDQRWQNNITGTPADIDRYKYGYDLNSNRQWKQNVVASAASVALDEYYDYDSLNRLTEMQRGTLNGGKTGITGMPVREMDYTLDITGNWSAYLTKNSGTTDLNQTRTSNKGNEITAISSTPNWSTPPTYDAAGNMTSFPQPANPSNAFTAVYDAWNRMVKISSGSSTVSTYQCDGRNRRIVKVTISISETRHFYYTNGWQDIEERTSTSTTLDQQYVWGIRYVDELVCRDDATPQRLYACQDANFKLTAIANTSGAVVERYVFDPYGTRSIYDASWTARSTSSYTWVIGHQGLALDVESGLVYNRSRYLQPKLGRFLQRDPAGYIDGASLYKYANGSPANRVDPSGLVGPGVHHWFPLYLGGALKQQAMQYLEKLEHMAAHNFWKSKGLAGPSCSKAANQAARDAVAKMSRDELEELVAGSMRSVGMSEEYITANAGRALVGATPGIATARSGSLVAKVAGSVAFSAALLILTDPSVASDGDIDRWGMEAFAKDPDATLGLAQSSCSPDEKSKILNDLGAKLDAALTPRTYGDRDDGWFGTGFGAQIHWHQFRDYKAAQAAIGDARDQIAKCGGCGCGN